MFQRSVLPTRSSFAGFVATCAVLALAAFASAQSAPLRHSDEAHGRPMETHGTETAVVAGGCFWCMEAVFERLAGVSRVESGYAGGLVQRPTYEQVSTGTTGHAESVRITFDPAVLSYRELLRVFFAFHDPTTRDRQGADVGPQYRSAVFFGDSAQQVEAGRVIAELTRERVFDTPIVTEVAPLTVFWPAEGHHQGYYNRNRDQPYCRIVISPKVAKLRAHYAGMLKESAR
jgi:peptide-methionine (S)-S-oxide reductase